MKRIDFQFRETSCRTIDINRQGLLAIFARQPRKNPV
jgi:hypothetical protein